MRALRLILLVFGLVLPAASAAGANIVLDDTRRSALAGLPVLRGEPFAETDLRGRTVVVAFFASWCPPCSPEFDHLKRAHSVHDPVVLAINIFEAYDGLGGPDRLDRFLARKAPAFRVLGEGEMVAGLFGEVDRIPTVFVFGRDGRPVLQFVHARDAAKTHVTFEELDAVLRAAR